MDDKPHYNLFVTKEEQEQLFNLYGVSVTLQMLKDIAYISNSNSYLANALVKEIIKRGNNEKTSS